MIPYLQPRNRLAGGHSNLDFFCLLSVINIVRWVASSMTYRFMLLLILLSANAAANQTGRCLSIDTPDAPLLSVDLPPEIGWHKPGVAPVGVNTLYWIDDDHAWLRTSLPRLLKESGIQTLRFPAGEAADNYDWESHALEDPNRWPGEKGGVEERELRTDYKEFLAQAKLLGIKHLFFVVNVDGAFRASGDLDANLRRYADKAARWVRAVKSAGHRVRYWEIGNEPYLPDKPLTASEYAKALSVFAKAMRAADPGILIGAAGPSGERAVSFADHLTPVQLRYFREQGDNNQKVCPGVKPRDCIEIIQARIPGKRYAPLWWPTLLKEAGTDFDFAVIHRYDMAKIGGLRAREGVFAFSDGPRRLRALLEEAKGGPVPIALTEWNTPARAGMLTETDHLLNIAIQLGNTLAAGVDFAHYWPLRFPSGKRNPLFSMDAAEATPTAKIFAIMSALSEPSWQLAESSPEDGIYILRGRQQKGENFVVVNTTARAFKMNLALSQAGSGSATIRRLVGAEDGHVNVRPECSEPLKGARVLSLSSPPQSITGAQMRFQ